MISKFIKSTLLFLFISLACIAQTPNYNLNNSNEKTTFGYQGPLTSNGYQVKNFSDTNVLNSVPYLKGIAGLLVRVGNKLYYRNAQLTGWIPISTLEPDLSFVDSVVVYANNNICQWKKGVPTCYTLSGGGTNTFTGIDSVTANLTSICQWKNGVPICYPLLGPGVDSVTLRDTVLCQWSAGIPGCYVIHGNVVQTGPTDSMKVIGNNYCWYFSGIQTCITISNSGRFYDSTSLNYNGTMYIHWNQGTKLDSIIAFTAVIGDTCIIIRDSSDGKAYFSFNPNCKGSGNASAYIPNYDVSHLLEIKDIYPAKGKSSSSNVTNYTVSSIDSVRAKFSTSSIGSSSTEYGGWLTSTLTGESIYLTAPFGVVAGDSQAEGHGQGSPMLHGITHNLTGGIVLNYPDSAGQLSYHLRTLTNMKWKNMGIGGETSVDLRKRFMRDVVGVPDAGVINGFSRTLLSKPKIAVLITGINDVFNGVAIQTTKDNIEWFAATLMENNIKCVILNLPGDDAASGQNLKDIAAINEWLKNGVLDQYGAVVVDYNSWWRNPSYNDDVHPSSLIYDDVHPSRVGYDSLANYIFRSAKLPKISKGIFYTERSPAGFTGFSKPTGITINGTAYTLPSTGTIDTLAIQNYISDSVPIVITSTVNITGTSYTGFSHVEWMLDNNPTNEYWVTKKTRATLVKVNPTMSSLNIVADALLNNNVLTLKTNNGVQLLNLKAGGGTEVPNMVIGNIAPFSNTTLSIGTGNSIGIKTNAGIEGGANSQFGSLQVGSFASASTTGYGITANGGSLQFQGTNSLDGYILKHWGSQLVAANGVANNSSHGTFNIQGGYGPSANGAVGIVLSSLMISAPISDSSTTCTTCYIGGINVEHSYVNTNKILLGFRNPKGNNYFNGTSGVTSIGTTNADSILNVNGGVKLMKLFYNAAPTMSMVVRDSITGALAYMAIPSSSGSPSIVGKTVYYVATGQSNINVNDQTQGNWTYTVDPRIKTLTSSGIIVTADPSVNNIAYDDVITALRNNVLLSEAKTHLIDYPYDTVVLVCVAVGSKGSWEWTPKTTGVGEIASTNTMLSLFMNRINLLPVGAKIDFLTYGQGEQDVVSNNIPFWLSNVIEFRDSCAKHVKFNSDFTMVIDYPVYARGFGLYQSLCTAIDSLLLTKKDLAMRKIIPVAYDLPNNLGDSTHFTNEAVEQIGIKSYLAYKTGKPVYDIILDTTLIKKSGLFNYTNQPFVANGTTRAGSSYGFEAHQNGSTNIALFTRYDAGAAGRQQGFGIEANNSLTGGAYFLHKAENFLGQLSNRNANFLFTDSTIGFVDSALVAKTILIGPNSIAISSPMTAGAITSNNIITSSAGIISRGSSTTFRGINIGTSDNTTGSYATAYFSVASGTNGSPSAELRGYRGATGGAFGIAISAAFSTPALSTYWDNLGHIAVGGSTSPSAWLTLPASTSAAGTGSFKVLNGVLLATPENNLVENDGSRWYITIGGVRYFISLTTSGSSSPSTTPAAIGLRHINTTTGQVYEATGTASSADWKLLN